MDNFKLQTGPFRYSITTDNNRISSEIHKLYEDFSYEDGFIDFDITISHSKGMRRWYRQQANFYLDEFSPFKPLPAVQAYPMLEWGMNWCIAQHAHHYFLMHAAAVEKNGKCLVLPAAPGSGKSTLTAALVFNGWRLLSDEIAICSLRDGLIQPLSRPINLKNDSIDIIGNFISDSVFSDIVFDTHKGTVALLKPPTESVLGVHKKAKLFSYVFPKYVAGATATLEPICVQEAFALIVNNSFNYHMLGRQGFEQVCEQLNQVNCYQFQYSQFDDALDMLTNLVTS